MSNPIYKIYGTERRRYKKELSEMKLSAKYFYHHLQFERDMQSFYGGDYVLSKGEADKFYNRMIGQINHLESELSVLYSS